MDAIALAFSICKLLHFAGLISWFAGLFYLPRLFVYHREALDLPNEAERTVLTTNLLKWEWKLYRVIMTPAMLVTVVAGVTMLVLHGMDWFRVNLWMHFKILFLILLIGYHHICKSMIKKFERGAMQKSSLWLRVFNEIPTILLVIIVTLAVFRQNLNPIYLAAGVVGFTGLLVWGIRAAQKKR